MRSPGPGRGMLLSRPPSFGRVISRGNMLFDGFFFFPQPLSFRPLRVDNEPQCWFNPGQVNDLYNSLVKVIALRR